MEYLYDKYHTGIDLVLYMLVLVTACRVALARMFPGEHGQRLGSVIGLVLAISLSVAEGKLGFSARSFGPIAAGLFVLVIALVIYNMMRHAGAGHVACGTTALIVTYFSIRAVTPEFFIWLKQNEWANYLHGVLVVAILVALWRTIHAMSTPHEGSPLRRLAENAIRNRARSRDSSKKRSVSEWRWVQDKLEKSTIQGKKQCKQVISILKQVASIIRRQGLSDENARIARNTLSDLKAREHVLSSMLSHTRDADARLLQFDLSKYEELKQRYRMLDKRRQAACKRMFLEERQKIGTEEAIHDLSARTETYTMQFNQCIDMACRYVSSGNAKDSIKWIEKAIEQEQEAERLIKDIRKQEKILLRLLKKQIARLTSSQNDF